MKTEFPRPMVIEFLLRHAARTGDVKALLMATAECWEMAHSPLYDQLGGGFHRYVQQVSPDVGWSPHFEK
jgi:uncharacterized protein YyaL (SSP411 family)